MFKKPIAPECIPANRSRSRVETVRMIEHGHWAKAATYTISSVVLGFLAVYLATAFVRRVRVRR